MADLNPFSEQDAPSGTTPVAIYTPGSGITGMVKSVTITNTTAAPVKYSIYSHKTGSTYDATTSLAKEIVLAGNDSIILEWNGPGQVVNGAAGNFAIQTDTADALTFTVTGWEKS